MPTLHWLGKEEDVKTAERVPYRLLQAADELSYGAPDAENMLIQGDNLDALKALLPYFAGQVKCIYIDPPYNSLSAAFTDYDDNLEHSQWLAMMWPRLELLWQLLTEQNGVILISVNDDEGHYLKVMCDEIFGRTKFIGTFVWNYEGNTDNQAKIINYHEYILVYSRSGKIDDPGVIDPNIDRSSKLFRDEIRNTIVKNGPKNPVSAIMLPTGFPAAFEHGEIPPSSTKWPRFEEEIVVRNHQLLKPVTVSSGWSSKSLLEAFIANGFTSVIDTKGQPTSFEITSNGAIEAVKQRGQAKGHVVSVLRGFGTTNQMRLLLEKIGVKFTFPKPVKLIEYLIRVFSRDADWILDSFIGSGTTGHATLLANKGDGANRRFIGIEISRETCDKVTLPRLRAVIDGKDDAELESLGAGFRFYRLGDSIFDLDGRINPKVRFAQLAAHVWFSETRTALRGKKRGPLLGVHQGTAYYLLYNGILGDKRPDGGNVLTGRVLTELPAHDGPRVIYGESCRLGAARLKAEGIVFRQTPYDLKAG